MNAGPKGARSEPGRVFVIVPTFNRWAYTRTCLECLARQTWPSITTIVSDGGSTDGTCESVATDFPDVIVAHDDKERWWAGSTALGIEHALAVGSDDDFILLLNNDTIIPDDYVATLVAASQREDAAVGAVVVDARDPAVILDAGEYIDWATYTFSVRTKTPPGEVFHDEVDVLPGRGSLVPLRMVRVAGNIDDAAFPHYIADYDFFCRVKAAGFRLGVCYETKISSYIETTGLPPSRSAGSFRDVWRELTSRRSMTNFLDHWRFVDRHAPHPFRLRCKLLLLYRTVIRICFGTPLARVARPVQKVFSACRITAKVVWQLWKDRHEVDNRFKLRQLPRPLAIAAKVIFLPRPMSEAEFAALGLDTGTLLRDGIITPAPVESWFTIQTLDPSKAGSVDAIAKIRRMSLPLNLKKVRHLVAYRRIKHSCSGERKASGASE